MTAYRAFLQAAVLGTAMSATTAYSQADVGLVNQMNGEVSYVGNGSASKAQAFMKVRQGDRFTVPAGAQVRVVYFQGGRQETWKGPATFRAGEKQSEAQSGQPTDVSTLPSSVPQKIAQVPELIQIAKLGRSGGVAVRGGGKPPRLTSEQQAEVSSAQAMYKQMRTQAQVDDVTPELYLYSVLQDYLLYAEMKPVVDEMVKRQPQNPEILELSAWVKSRAPQ
jgi:hypothetical protein